MLLRSDGPLTVLVVHRPGSSPPSKTFFEELATLLEQFALYYTQINIARDFNFILRIILDSPATSNFQVIAGQFVLISKSL